MSSRVQRPADDEYFVEPWSTSFLQGDIFDGVPLAYPWPADALMVEAGQRRFVSGPFDVGPAILLTPSCVMAAQKPAEGEGLYAHPVRTLVPIRPVEELVAAGAFPGENVNLLRQDRLLSYLYLPASGEELERAALLYMPVTLHHDLIADLRVGQLSGAAHRHLRYKLIAYSASFAIDDITQLGDPEPDHSRTI